MLHGLQNVGNLLCLHGVAGVAGVADSFKALRLGHGPLKILQRLHMLQS